MSVVLLIAGLVMFVGLVVVHELGHFLAARRSGVTVEEFGIGFPPRAYKKLIRSRRGDFILSLNWLPLGGFVRLKGEHDADNVPGSFGRAPLGAKIKIMLAGVGVNLLVAYILLAVLAVAGVPRLVDNQFSWPGDTRLSTSRVLIVSTEKGSPADAGGLKTGDRLVSVKPVGCSKPCAGLEIKNPASVRAVTEQLLREGNTKLEFIIESSGGQTRQITLTPRDQQTVAAAKAAGRDIGYLGLVPAQYALQRHTWSAPLVAAGLIKQFTVLTLKGLGSAVAALARGQGGQAGAQVAGPVGVFVILRDSTILGPLFIVFIIAIISLTLAIMNSLPVPALDGGRLFVMLAFRAARQRLTRRTEDLIHGAGFALLLLLLVLITVADVRRLS